MNRAASLSHQAGEGSAFPEGLGDETGMRQPFDPFEDLPRGVSNEEVGFGSLAFEDSVIVDRPDRERPSRSTRMTASADGLARLRTARAFARG